MPAKGARCNAMGDGLSRVGEISGKERVDQQYRVEQRAQDDALAGIVLPSLTVMPSAANQAASRL
jgi:hypothetical protein